MSKAQRFLGIELGGSRRTAAVSMDFFDHDKKIFLREIESPVEALGDETPDESLVRLVGAMEPLSVGVDAPLTLPPLLWADQKAAEEAMEWMRAEARRQRWGRGKQPCSYSLRPVDMLLRGPWQEDVIVPFPVDDSFGSSRAPLAARMQYLQRQLPGVDFVEAIPRLALGGIARWYGLSAREVRRARDVEEGVDQRMGILDSLSQQPRSEKLPQLFLYKTDIATLAQDLSAFDAFLCAFMAVLGGCGFLEAPRFPAVWGNVAKPVKELG
jgi:hypothetical protein